MRTVGEDTVEHDEQIFVAFQREQASDLADDKSVARDTETVAQEEIIGGVGKRFSSESTEDARIIFRPADARSEIKVCHRIGGTQKMRSELCSVTFGGGEDGIGEVSLKRAEGWAVNVVDDDGDFGACGGDAPKDTGFAAVCVNDVGLLFFELSRQLPECEEIFQRMNGADEGGDDCQEFWVIYSVFKRTFRSGGWTGNKFDGDVGLLA